jgi:hypothetical protein
MKYIIKTIFKLHILIFKYPCRSNIRLALEQPGYVYDLDWRVGMLYVCGESLGSISDWVYLEKQEVIGILNNLAVRVVI